MICEKVEMSITDITGVTQVTRFELKYEWKIFNFSLSDKAIGQCLRSAIFSPAEDVNIKWSLKIYPEADNLKNKDYISLFLEFHPTESKNNIKAKFDLCIGEEKNIKSHGNVIHHFEKGKYDWGFPQFISKSDFSNNAKFLSNDCLTVSCNITGNTGIATQPNRLRNNLINTETPYNQHLLSGYETLFKNQELTDVALNASGKSLTAHKAILGAHSPVFLAMFSKNMKEKFTNEVDIPDVEFNVLQEVLRFLYCGKVENMEDYVYDLLIASDKYAIEPLKLECEKYLLTYLKIENVLDALSIADTYHAKHLRKYAIEFFLNHKSQISKTECFKSFSKLQPHTIEEITRRLINNS